MEGNLTSSKFSFETIIANAIKIPGVNVNRNGFLSNIFSDIPDMLPEILEKGPVAANVPREKLKKIANRLILDRTCKSSIASFAMGIPGGVAMAATIPGDILQFYGIILRMAQELAYIYGAEDLWENGELNTERVTNCLIIYCGVMFGVAGAIAGLHVLSNQLAKAALKEIPKKALTKTFWYPILKKICKALSINITKKQLAKTVSKAIPFIGGVISGVINFSTMKPMGKKLLIELDKMCFTLSEEELQKDIEYLENCNTDDNSNKVNK